MNHRPTSAPGARGAVSSHSVFGAPCWVSLTSRDLDVAEEFYRAVLGWRLRPAKLGDRFRMAMVDDTPVAGIAAVASLWQMAGTWTPYLSGPRAAEASAPAPERCGAAAGGPVSLPLGGGGAL